MAALNSTVTAKAYIDEKALTVVEQSVQPDTSVANSDDDLLSADARPDAERRLVRQLDLRLMPTIIIIFIMNYIDVGVSLSDSQRKELALILHRQRSAVSSARLQGLTQDLHLSQIQYSTVLAVLCASYVPAQIPSNMVSKH